MFSNLRKLFSRPITPRYVVVEIEKPVPVVDHSDAAAMASLQNHPGMIALLNRLRLQRIAVEQKMLTTHHRSLDDVNFLVSCAVGLRFVESQIRNATQTLEVKRQREAQPFEQEEFDTILRSIESVRPQAEE